MNYSSSFHKLMLGIAVALCAFAPASADTITIVNDTFDDGDLGVNAGIGNGFNSQALAVGALANEAGGSANLIIPTNGGRRGEIVSDPGLFLAIGSTSPTNGGGFGDASVLFFEAADDTRQILATFEFDTLNVNPADLDADPFDFSPTLGFNFELTEDTFSLDITGDTVTVLTGALSGSVSHGLTNGFAAFGAQNENPGVDVAVGQVVVSEIVAPVIPEPSSLALLGLGGFALLSTRKRKLA